VKSKEEQGRAWWGVVW